MNSPQRTPTIDRSKQFSPEEWDARINLAACYRAVAHFRMTDLIYNHISLRVPGENEHFLINPFGFLYEEVTASNLVKIDLDGNIVDDSPHPINPAGFVIHSAVHAARHDVACVIHTHTQAGVAVSAQKDGLLMISQHAMRFHNRVAYHDYQGAALDPDERESLVADLGDKKVMILRNHGLLTAGETVREAFDLIFHLENACKIQTAALAGGREITQPAPEICELTASQFEMGQEKFLQGRRDWDAILRLVDRLDPSFRS
jgi:ribulose-5-phosphate 4-epimerase/fuculose-1-phosphate aldolase